MEDQNATDSKNPELPFTDKSNKPNLALKSNKPNLALKKKSFQPSVVKPNIWKAKSAPQLASYPGLLAPAFVACSTNAGEGLV